MIIEILGEQFIERNRVRRWLRGKHPDLGAVIQGYTGWETVQELEIKPEILSEQVIHSQGNYRRVRRWLRGKHPDLGVLVHGLTGWETVQEIDVIKATKTYYVKGTTQVPSRSTENTLEYPDLRSVA